MRVRWLIGVLGTVNGHPDGVQPGLIDDIPEHIAEAYLANGYVSRKLDGPLPRPFNPQAGGAMAISSGEVH